MELMDDATEDAIRMLTKYARGDVVLVREALSKHERDGVDKVLDYIRDHRKPLKALGSSA